MAAVGPVSKENEKEMVSDYILHHLPDWILD
jgi:hypothetical protein